MWSTLSPRVRALLQAFFVTFLWSTSWVFIKIGLRDDIPPLTFAGLRYTLAFVCLLLIGLRRPAGFAPLRKLSWVEWEQLIILGLLFYSVNQGAQFVGLALLPSSTVNLLLSLSAIAVTFAGMYLLAEYPAALQWGGVGIYAAGVMIYFYPVAFGAGELPGVLVVLCGVFAYTVASLLGRRLNHAGNLSPLSITTVSMGVGSVVLLAAGILTQGLLPLSPISWLMIGWLAVVNTAFAFTLWNHTLRTLSAMESSIINNTMLIQIPILTWLFLGENLSPKAVIGLAFALFGILLVQLRNVGAFNQKQKIAPMPEIDAEPPIS